MLTAIVMSGKSVRSATTTTVPRNAGGSSYRSWKDEGKRPTVQVQCITPEYNTFYQDLVKEREQQAKDDEEKRLFSIINDNRSIGVQFAHSRNGSKGAPWRHMKMTSGARGENVMFVDGEVKVRDMSDYCPPSARKNEEAAATNPPKPLPHYYINHLTLDTNTAAAWNAGRKNTPTAAANATK